MGFLDIFIRKQSYKPASFNNNEEGNKEYREVVTSEVSDLLWSVIYEAEAAGWQVHASSGLLHEGARALGRHIRDQRLSSEQARLLARQIVRPYAQQPLPGKWW